MDATVRFYHGVLGRPACGPPSAPRSSATTSSSSGPKNTVAFFEYTGADLTPFAKPAGVPDPRAVQFDHLSFNLPDEHALLDAADRSSKSAGCEVTDVVDHGFIQSIYFTDPTASPSRRRGGLPMPPADRRLRRRAAVLRSRPGTCGRGAAESGTLPVGPPHQAGLTAPRARAAPASGRRQAPPLHRWPHSWPTRAR